MTLTDLARESLELPPQDRRPYIQREFLELTGRTAYEADVTVALRDALRMASLEYLPHLRG